MKYLMKLEKLLEVIEKLLEKYICLILKRNIQTLACGHVWIPSLLKRAPFTSHKTWKLLHEFKLRCQKLPS